MKKYIQNAFVIMLAFAGCQQMELTDSSDSILIAKIGDSNTRTCMGEMNDGGCNVLWSKDDKIKVFFDDAREGSQFNLISGEGTTFGKFQGKCEAGDKMIAYYPAENVKFRDNHLLGINLPARQSYVKNTFDAKSFPMCAGGREGELNFQNICSVLKVSMTGKRQIDSIVFHANSDEARVAGDAFISVTEEDGKWNANLLRSMTGVQDLVLDCGTGVMLNEEEPIDFHFVLPGFWYEGGFSLSIYTPDGCMKKSTTSSVSLVRSHIHSIPPFKLRLAGDPEESPGQIDTLLIDRRTYIELPCAAKKIEVPVRTNAEYTVECDVDWLRQVSDTKTLVTKTLLFEMDLNPEPSKRYGNICFTFGANYEKEYITIVQDGFAAPYVRLQHDTVTVGAHGETILTSLEMNRELNSVTTDASWLKNVEYSESVSFEDSWETEVTISVSALANETKKERVGHIYVASEEGRDTIYIVQPPTEPALPEAQDTIKTFRLVYEVEKPGKIELSNGIGVSFLKSEAEIVKVDYGDGTVDETNYVSKTHFYEDVGDKTVTVYYKGNPTKFNALMSGRELFTCLHGQLGHCTPIKKIEYPSTFTVFDYFGSQYGGGSHLVEVTFLGNVPESNPFSSYSADLAKINSKYSQEDGHALIKDGVLIAFTPAGYTKDEYVVPEGVHTIADGAFSLSQVKKVVLPSTIKKIGREAFETSGVEDINFPEGLEEIGYRAFISSGLKSVHIPESVKTIGDGAFADNEKMTEAKVDCNQVSYDMFIGCGSLVTVVLGQDVETICQGAFCSCKSLQTIEIPESVKTIDDFAFSGCESLLSISIPKSLTNLGESVFSECYSLVNVDFDSDIAITSLKERVFRYCSSLTKIIIPKSVKNVYERAFEGCSSLSEVIFEDGGNLQYIGSNAFESTALQKVVLPEGMTAILDETFNGCQTLSHINIPTTVRTIGKKAFAYTNLSEIIIPDSVESIAANVFQECASLNGLSVCIGKGLKVLDPTAFTTCSKLRSISSASAEFPVSDDKKCLLRASDGALVAYAGYDDIDSYRVPDRIGGVVVSSIGHQVFGYSGLKSVELPHSIVHLGLRCLNYAGLESVYLKSVTPPTMDMTSTSINEGGFSMIGSSGHPAISDKATIYVPLGTADAYKSAKNWSRLATNIVEYSY